MTFNIPLVVPLIELKIRLYQKTGTPASQQRIIFGGYALGDDTKLLTEYNVTKGSTLHMVLGLSGC
ncbi:UNVERIFIED_CONTAM: hypothetical protein GTU68_033920 [Idotea baltica]|nr:hypothetical protein [Idotea baltica]